MAEVAKPSLLTRKDWRILAIAVGLGVVSVVLMNFYVKSLNKQEEPVSVAVAAQRGQQSDAACWLRERSPKAP
jgi:hypothetical protein